MKIFSAIIKFSLANRFAVLAVSLIIAVYGLHCARTLPVDILPDLDKTMATIVSEAPGMAPEEIETLVSVPLENALSGMGGVSKIRSYNTPSLSLVNIEFGWDTDPYKIRQLVQERLQTAAPLLPEGVVPVIAPISSVMGEIMVLGISTENPKVSPIELRTLADYVVARRLSNIQGVSQALSAGGGLKQYRIVPDTRKMAALGVSFDDIEDAARNAQSNTGGGIVNRGGSEITLRNVGRTASTVDLGNSVVKSGDGRNILLKDVAEVRIDSAQLRGDGAVNGRPAVIITLTKQPETDTLAISKAVEKAVEEINKSLPSQTRLVILYRQDAFIKSAVANVEYAIRDGAVMVVLILLMFLLNIRTTLITITAIPMSLAVALIYFKLTGASINTMTLGGLAVAIGMLVDDAIVDVENAHRRLRENRLSANPRNPLGVILDACVEIRASIFYATALVMIVFIPTFALGGIEGKMFRPLSEAVIVSMAASFAVALTLIPALCSVLLGKGSAKKSDPIFSRAIKFATARLMITPSIRFPHIALILTGALTASALALFPMMGRDFIPQLNEGGALLIVQLTPDSSIERSREIGALVQGRLSKIPDITSLGMKIGRSEKDDHAEPVNVVKFNVSFDTSKRSQKQIVGEMRRKLDAVSGITYSIGQPMAHRIDYMLSGTQSQIAVKLYGENIDILTAKARELAEEAKSIRGAKDVNVEKQSLTPQIRIVPDRKKAAMYGVQIGKINETLRTILGGKVVGEVVDGEKVFDIFVRLDENRITEIDKLKDILIENISGEKYPLSSFAKVEYAKGYNHINRENLKRRIVVEMNSDDGDSVAVAQRLREIIDTKLKLPSGYYASVEGQFQSRIDAGKSMGLLFVFSLLAIFALLYMHFGRTSLVLQIMLGIPTAFAGGIFSTWYFIGTMSVASLIGMIALSGIAARNTIMMISHYIHLENVESEKFGEHLILRGTLERLNPILMTALTAAFALIPLMLNPDESGKELLYPVAVMIVGGLISSTFLSLIATPAAYALFGENLVARAPESEKKG